MNYLVMAEDEDDAESDDEFDDEAWKDEYDG